MDIRQLRYFAAIVEQGSFSRAAAALRVAQPALSLHVRNMEADLGTSLLFRSPKGVVPTEAGEILLRNARIILDQLAIAEDELRGYDNEPVGEVRVGLPGTFGQVLAVPLIMAARSRFPKIKLRIAETMSGFAVEWIRDARIDLAVVYHDLSEKGVVTIQVLEEELVCFGPVQPLPGCELPKGNRTISYEMIANLPLILPGGRHGFRDLLERHAAGAGITLNTIIEVDSHANIKELVRSGVGYSILSMNSISCEVKARQVRYWSIGKPPIKRPVYLVHSVNRPLTNAVAAMKLLVLEIMHDLARKGNLERTTIIDEAVV
jgi:LysR family nitrogen assimilation transcriptional regulator